MIDVSGNPIPPRINVESKWRGLMASAVSDPVVASRAASFRSETGGTTEDYFVYVRAWTTQVQPGTSPIAGWIAWFRAASDEVEGLRIAGRIPPYPRTKSDSMTKGIDGAMRPVE